MKRSEANKALADKTPQELETGARRRCIKEQFGLRMQKATQQLTNTAKLESGAPMHRAHQDDAAPGGTEEGISMSAAGVSQGAKRASPRDCLWPTRPLHAQTEATKRHA
jgi:ribosomal protein L29